MKGRFFVDVDPRDAARAVLDATAARHLRALRLTRGDEVCAIVGPGREHAAVIERLERERAVLSLGAALPPSGRDPAVERALAIGLGDAARMDVAIEKATELGATAIQPFAAERSQTRTVAAARLERWRRIARAACEQCGRTREPAVRPCVDFDGLLASLPRGEEVWLLTPRRATREERAVAAAARRRAPAVLVVGPEGGLSEAETARLLEHGARPMSLGRSTLRFETAAIAALAAAAALFPDG